MQKIQPLTLGEIRKLYVDTLSEIYERSEATTIARFMFEEVMQLNSLYQSLQTHLILTVEQERVLLEYLTRLKKKEPFQHVLGFELFYGCKFNVNPDVLIPRPETEELVQWIIENEQQVKSIIDIGTGSGCIAVSLAKNLPNAEVDAVDVSENAVEMAKANAALNNTTVNFSVLDILHSTPSRPYDVIVSNPPYIGDDEKKLMDDNVLLYEPHLALFPENQPLLFYQRISEIGQQFLPPGGRLYFEMNEFYANEIAAIAEQLGYKDVTIKKDINGKDRMLRALKS